MNSAYKQRLTALDENEFSKLLSKVEKASRPLVRRYPGATPRGTCLHRHFRGQKVAVVDARLEFDLRTLEQAKVAVGVKPCSAWVDAALEGLKAPRINFELGIGISLPHEDGGVLWDPEKALDFVVGAWLACKPVLEHVRGKG
jgi:hypothetical protein